MVPATAMCAQSSPWNVSCSKAGAMAVLRSSQGAASRVSDHREQHGPRDREHVVQDDRGGGVHQQHAEGEALYHAEQLQEEEVADVRDAHVPGAGAVQQHHPCDVAKGGDAESDDHGQQADQDHSDQLRDATRARLGSRVKVTRPVRWLHSAVTARMPSTGSSRLCGVAVAPTKLMKVSWSAPRRTGTRRSRRR